MYICNVFFRFVLLISKFFIMGIWFNFVFYKFESVFFIDNLELMFKYFDVSKYFVVYLLFFFFVVWYGWLWVGIFNIFVDIVIFWW